MIYTLIFSCLLSLLSDVHEYWSALCDCCRRTPWPYLFTVPSYRQVCIWVKKQTIKCSHGPLISAVRLCFKVYFNLKTSMR